MSIHKLKDRIAEYESTADVKLLPKVPIVISLNGRAFSKLTSLTDKPYCAKFAEAMYGTMIKMMAEIDGTVFAYSFSDEIIIICRNDQTLDTNQWYNNKIQKMVSASAAMATLHFNNYLGFLDLKLIGDPIFLSQTYAVPSITETINVIISKQQQSLQSSIYFACFYELLNRKYNKEEIKDMLMDTTLDQKIDLLKQECGVDYNNYPSAFRRGVACYRSPKLVDGNIKQKLYLNLDIPIFTKEHSFLSNIFKNGTDVVRQNIL